MNVGLMNYIKSTLESALLNNASTASEDGEEPGALAATMGAARLSLIDVGSVADVVLVAFTWPATGDRRYVYAQSVEELARECDDDVPCIVSGVITGIDETLAGGDWLAAAESPQLLGLRVVTPTWQDEP